MKIRVGLGDLPRLIDGLESEFRATDPKPGLRPKLLKRNDEPEKKDPSLIKVHSESVSEARASGSSCRATFSVSGLGLRGSGFRGLGFRGLGLIGFRAYRV